MPVKNCVGVLLYHGYGGDVKYFLMESPKWKGYVVPGGEINSGESEEDACKRELKEELGKDFEITDLVKFVDDTIKTPSPDFYDQTIEFHFRNYMARALQTEIDPDKREIGNYGWFRQEETTALPMPDDMKEFLRMGFEYLRS